MTNVKFTVSKFKDLRKCYSKEVHGRRKLSFGNVRKFQCIRSDSRLMKCCIK